MVNLGFNHYGLLRIRHLRRALSVNPAKTADTSRCQGRRHFSFQDSRHFTLPRQTTLHAAKTDDTSLPRQTTLYPAKTDNTSCCPGIVDPFEKLTDLFVTLRHWQCNVSCDCIALSSLDPSCLGTHCDISRILYYSTNAKLEMYPGNTLNNE